MIYRAPTCFSILYAAVGWKLTAVFWAGTLGCIACPREEQSDEAISLIRFVEIAPLRSQ
jgi:hypothetical protein